MRNFLMLTVLLSFSLTYLNAQNMPRKKANVSATYEIIIDAPIDTVWKALAIDYGGIGKWASGVNHVIESSGQGITAERSCSINAAGFNDTKEKVIKYDEANYYFEYDLYEGLPKFVDYSINKDKLEPKDGKTLWISTNEMRVGGLVGATMKGFMTKKLNAVMESKAMELKHFIETGRQHPNKLSAIASKEKKTLFVLEQIIDAPTDEVWKVIAHDFAKVSDSHPVSPKSDFTDGSTTVKEGARRIMYMSKNEKKYFVDEIQKLDHEKHELLINVIKAKGYPIDFSNVEFIVDSLTSNTSRLTMVFSYKTKPRFLQKLAKKSLQKQLQEYLYAIDYHVETGTIINKKKWKSIRKSYLKKKNDKRETPNYAGR